MRFLISLSLLCLGLSSDVSHAADLKTVRSALLGKWTIAEEETKAIALDKQKYPWLVEKCDRFLQAKPSWDFREDGTVVETIDGRATTKGFYLMQDDKDDIWIVMAKSDNFSLFKTVLETKTFKMTAVARDETGSEVPILGTLVLKR
jgi:hypothetical protein